MCFYAYVGLLCVLSCLMGTCPQGGLCQSSLMTHSFRCMWRGWPHLTPLTLLHTLTTPNPDLQCNRRAHHTVYTHIATVCVLCLDIVGGRLVLLPVHTVHCEMTLWWGMWGGMQVSHVRGLALEQLIRFPLRSDNSERRNTDVQACDSIFVFTHPHLSVFVSLSPFSVSLRYLWLGQCVSFCMCVCVRARVCTCRPRLSPCGCYFRSYEGILSLPPPSFPTTGVRMGGRRERWGGNGKGTRMVVVGGGRRMGFQLNKSFFFLMWFLTFFLHSS